MNKKQKRILISGILLFIIMVLNPPWTIEKVHYQTGKTLQSKPIGYRFILSNPDSRSFRIKHGKYYKLHISYNQLILQIIALSIAVGGFVWITKDN